MTTKILGGALVTALLLAPADGLAQETRWQVTASMVTGGFTSQLASEPFTTNIRFGDQVGGVDGDEEFPITFNQGDEENRTPYSFDSFTGFGATAEWRRARLGVFGSLSWIPTRAVAVVRDDIPTQAAIAFGFEPSSGPNTAVQIRLKTAQNLLIPMAGVNFYSADLPQPGRPPEPYEFYGTLGLGIVSYMNDEPLLENAGDSWDTPILFNAGGGLFVNFTSAVGLRVDLKGSFWKTEIPVDNGETESKTQMMIHFSPGFVFIL